MSLVHRLSHNPSAADATVPAEQAPPVRRPDRRRLVLLALGSALLAWFLWQANLTEMARALAGANYVLVGLTIAGNLLTPVLRSFRFKQLYGVPGGVLPVAGLMAQFGFLNQALPMRTGEVAFLVLLKRWGIIPSIAEAAPRWLLLRGCDLAAILVLLVLTLLVFPPQIAMGHWVAVAQVALCVALGGMALAVVALKRLPAAGVSAPPPGFLRGRLWAVRRGLEGLESMTTLLVTLLWSLAIWGWQATLVSLQYIAFRTLLPLDEIWTVTVSQLTLSTLPIHAPLSIGTMHAVQVGLLHAFGVAASPALGIAIGLHAAMVITVVLQGIVGAVTLRVLTRRGEGWRVAGGGRAGEGERGRG